MPASPLAEPTGNIIAESEIPGNPENAGSILARRLPRVFIACLELPPHLEGWNDSPVQVTRVALMLRLGPETSHAAPLVVGVELEPQADGFLDAALGLSTESKRQVHHYRGDVVVTSPP